MSPPIAPEPGDRPQRRGLSSGQVLAEACIGLSVLTLVWMFMAFSTYMANNRIRTAMAVRDAVWLQSNGESTQSVPGRFFPGNDAGLAAVPAAQNVALDTGGVPAGPWSGGAWVGSVSFGMQTSGLQGTTRFPFVLLNMHIPILPPTIMEHSMDQFLTVTATGAWPSDTSATWTNLSDALGGSGLGIPSF